MPRPGPRPYECVRRAWHSDRHQPMRGSLIQELFRMANEAHSPATRKNREWQEKLPFVVFKAEEIMYSKANSESEYMDLSTLWPRANDAIDTIIRKDDSSPSPSPSPSPAAPDLLQPCIEAALNLGCIPRRASRSQRHTNPGCYLSSPAKYNSPISLQIPDGSKPPAPPQFHPSPPDSADLPTSAASWYSAVLKSAAPNPSAAPPPCSRPSLLIPASSDPAPSRVVVISYESPPLSSNNPSPSVDPYPYKDVDAANSPEFGRTYPLCYFGGGTTENSRFQLPLHPPPVHKQQGAAGETFGAKSAAASSSDNAPIDAGAEAFAADSGCDLSLRLGLPSPAWSGAESSWTDEAEDVGSSSSCGGGGGGNKFRDPSPCRARAVNVGRSIAPAEDKCFEFF